MRFIPLFLLLFIYSPGPAQPMTGEQQKALNGYVDYANRSADEVASLVTSIANYYSSIHQRQTWNVPRYTCPVQPEEYYLTQARTLSKSLSATLATPLNARLEELYAVATKIDEKCKALDTYHKLEDYKQDNFAKAESIVNELQLLVAQYHRAQRALQTAVDAAREKLTAGATATAYHKADALMRTEVLHERDLLDQWNLNLQESVHTGWPVEKLGQSILETDTHLQALQKIKPALQYPASSMWTSFQSNLASVLELKRRALDDYNFEAKKSDKHSNEVYLSLINYYNGTLVSDYNTFTQFAERDGYHGVKLIRYFPVFEIRTNASNTVVTVMPFHEVAHTAIAMPAQKTAVGKNVFAGLTHYVDFIYETWRQTRYMQTIVSNFSASAAYYKNLESFDRRAAMSFDFKDFKVPLSDYQKAVSGSSALPPAVAKSLNAQAETLLNILKEMDALGAALEQETAERRYEKDRLKKVYEILDRQKVLFETWDEKKEQLYNDVRAVFDAYPPANPASSWYKSGRALHDLVDLDHEALFIAKAHYKGNAVTAIPTAKIDAALRDVISKEYENMKGIEKIGRNNGLCPYTPYEDLPQTSKSLSEEFQKLKPAREGRYEHPYYRMMYYYNEVVDDYNKFCELSKEVPHLKTIPQPELFVLASPEPANPKQAPVAQPTSNANQSKPAAQQPSGQPAPNAARQTAQQPQAPSAPSTSRVQHDTIYIERRDTVYIAEPGENLRSMDGYATNNMVLLLDVSGSMNTPEKLPLLKESVLSMLSMMRPEDQVSIVTFSSKPKALLEATSFREEEKVKNAIRALKPSGKTEGNAGIRLAYKVADANYIRGGNNRIILATDGEFTLNDETRALIQKFADDDIFLSVFNFGKGAGASKTLANLATAGKGNYAYISRENVDLRLIREAKAKKKK